MRTVGGTVGVLLLLVAVLVGGVLLLTFKCSADSQRTADARCAKHHATATYVGKFHWLCISDDGRVVDSFSA
jgi:predicted DNA-binding protein (MmcQ/YjbR family)